MDKLSNEKGISLIEVLASIVIISIIFSVVSSYILSSAQHTKSMSNKYTAVQLAESLLNVYKDMEYSFLQSKTGATENINIQATLGLDNQVDRNYSATLSVARHNNYKLSDRVLLLTVKVYTMENGVKKETILEGYRRK
ncbi:prepilin-type N-terminal cleavage/methylation domain-containing protein [Mesobacillus subterraneus]|uniref:prepilin-type N-terminal cleavage/methylation domain-containing protein n=1 Tax=Mesobacillus subterraneus TaxID=285983 RepID=UPI001CFD4FBA|nr:prepilin-type N-terminal cleavage/methylation domain-containing protein [Mesobacillus subterraneus]WLR56180.1 prepilin-type N-terminal cleavage/methylation domain-containing protein [Mesobacillus subterraneus]